MDSDSTKKIYKSGELVPKDGIYKVSHVQHRLPHKASFKAPERFPVCNKCGRLVRFELLVPAEDQEGERQALSSS